MKCMACGKELPSGSRFCSYCGAAVSPVEDVSPSVDENESNVIILNDEDGNEIPFEFLDLIPYRGNEYVVLFPMDDDDTGEVVILQVEDGGEENDNYLSVDDQSTLNAVFAIFKERNKDSFNFT